MASDDDFGPFVGPLDAAPTPQRPSLRTEFLQQAKANTDRNRRAVLDELLAHEDDPLYFHTPTHCAPAPPVESTPVIHPEQSPPTSHSWLSTLHDHIPASAPALPFSRSFFSLRNAANAAQPVASASRNTSATPFAQHVFVPIPGAPGFRPDEYDWDKGFSEQLDREARMADSDSAASPQDGRTATRSQSLEELDSFKSASKVGEYIEQNCARVDLVGRRVSTVPVLSTSLVDKAPYTLSTPLVLRLNFCTRSTDVSLPSPASRNRGLSFTPSINTAFPSKLSIQTAKPPPPLLLEPGQGSTACYWSSKILMERSLVHGCLMVCE
jgi:hypothetical protein